MDDSIKHRLKKSLCCCFHHPVDDTASITDHHHYNDAPSPTTPRQLLRSSSQWIKSRSHDLPEFKEKCRNLISRIGPNNRRRRSHSADFRYDPLSYALNFDEGDDYRDLDALPEDRRYMSPNFASPSPQSLIRTPIAMEVSRLTVPDRTFSGAVAEGASREITALR